MTIEVGSTKKPVTEIACDAVVVGAGTNSGTFALSADASRIDAALNGYLSEYLSDIAYKGDLGSVVMVPSHNRLPAKTLVVAGLGGEERSKSTYRRAAAASIRRLSERTHVASALHGSDAAAIAPSVEGFLLGSHQTPSQKRDPKPSKVSKLEIIDADPAELKRGRVYAEATLRARDLVNEPASVLDPQTLSDRAQAFADGAGLDCEVLGQKELEKGGFGGLLAVARGSTAPPRLIRLRHRPRKAR
ncbi:MAG: leucyl aminopeptidase, partial [Actinomycetota bacterium]|nr:leucyl aminopeptidase [Actinomycetota bacterium]